jgi:cytochrome c553
MVMKLVTLTVLGVTALCAADGAKVFGAKCAECHGADGKDVSISGKAIAGDGATLTKLTGYKNGTYGGEQKATMLGSIADLSDDDLKAVSAHVGNLK